MRILHSHNDYRLPRKEQIQKAIHYIPQDEPHYPVDHIMLEADIIYMFGKVRLAHEKSYNPLKIFGLVGWSGRWHGTLDDYVRRASEADIKYIMIEAKTAQKELVYAVDDLTLRYPNITFIVLDKYWSYSEFVFKFSESHALPYCRNIISFDEFFAQNEIVSIDFY